MPYPSFTDLPPIHDYRVVTEATDAKDPDVLEQLSYNEDPNVRARVAENGRTPIAVLERLALEESPFTDYIRQYLVRNQAVPFYLLKQLMHVEHKGLKTKIFTRLLDGYKQARVELTGEEVHVLLRELVPLNMNDLEFIELLETIHEVRDQAQKARK